MVKEGRHVQRQQHLQAHVHIHMVSNTHIINSLVPQLSRWLWQAPSLINDQWWTVRLRNEQVHHDSIPQSLRGSEGNTGSNVTSKWCKEAVLSGCSFCQQHSPVTCWKVDFLRDGGNSQGLPAAEGCRVFYILLWNSVMFTSFNNWLTLLWKEKLPPGKLSSNFLNCCSAWPGARGSITHAGQVGSLSQG